MTNTEVSASEQSAAYLIWEDADDKAWWLARSHDQDAVYVIAVDAITHHILVLRQSSKDSDFRVIAALPRAATEDLAKGLAEGKRTTVKWLGDQKTPDIRSGVRNWRARRWSKIALREVPVASVAFAVGVLLAIIVAAFSIMTNINGWVMIAVGTVFGASAGFLLKWLVDRKLRSFLGPLGRFLTVTGSAALGALLTTSTFFVLFSG